MLFLSVREILSFCNATFHSFESIARKRIHFEASLYFQICVDYSKEAGKKVELPQPTKDLEL